MELSSKSLQISSDPEFEGFDLSAGDVWIYPENYPVRTYQFDIVQTALYNNTLVCLPTGLGKTFIAAVIMYNFWRWYPCGRVIFLAPTKPLVAQQIYACHNIMGIPSTETIELTGTINQSKRQTAWLQKRVIFATPQVFYNDLEKNIVPAHKIKCVIIDEAHKALGKHSYCECIRLLHMKNQKFRILGLSATPGNKIDNVHEVLKNLHIAQLELRDETSPDVVPYINERKIDILRVPLSEELLKYKEQYIFIMDRHVKLLLQCNVLQGQTANISKGRIFHLLRDFQNKTDRSANYGQIIKTLNILMTMYHAYELMVRNGLRAFYKFYKNHSDKFWMNDEHQLQQLLDNIEEYLGAFPDTNSHGGDIPDIPSNLIFGHPKFEKLKEILSRHFSPENEHAADTRAIVFVEYRDIVSEVYILLLQLRPTVRPQMFMGQAGQKQKQQKQALEDFRSNHVNVLISTSIGEEGLDVGQVDLIICFDITQNSPIRLVQRMGRTGRKREGHIIILVTDGKEYETLRTTIARRDSLNNKILNTSNIHTSLYQDNPRMIPNEITPTCRMMHIAIQPKAASTKESKKNKSEREKERKSSIKKNKAQTKSTKTSTTEQNIMQSKRKGQTTMASFFKNKVYNDDDDSDSSSIQNFMTTQRKIHNSIPASDVKLLSCDNEAIEFLTLCALKRSEAESNMTSNEISELPYAVACIPKKIDYDFSIPDIEILNCLSDLQYVRPVRNVSQDKTTNEITNYNDDNVNEEINDINVLSLHEYSLMNDEYGGDDKFTPIGESRFEDLLDESDDSAQSDPAESVATAELRFDNKTRSPNVETMPYINHNKSSFVESAERSTDNPGAQELGGFEDLLDNSSDSCDANVLEDDCFRHVQSLGFEENKGLLKKQKESAMITSETNDQLDKMEKHVTVYAKESQENDKTESSLSTLQNSNKTGRINSLLTLEEADCLSDEDMFDDLADVQFDDLQEDLTAEWNQVGNNETDGISNEPKSPHNLSSTQKLVEYNNVKNDEKDLKVHEFDWNDDAFAVTTEISDSTNVNSSFNTSPVLANGNQDSRNITKSSDSDDNAWLSTKKLLNERSRKASTPSIAQKLASIRKSATLSNIHNRNKSPEIKNNSKNDFIAHFENKCEITDKENSFFFDTSENERMTTRDSPTSSRDSRGILSLKREKDNKTETIDMHVFAAPQKYVAKRIGSKSKEVTTPDNKTLEKKKHSRKSKDRKRAKKMFIVDEAEVSPNASSDENSNEDDDDGLSSFLSYTQNVYDEPDMHAHYLQSIRSPIKRNNFIFKPESKLDESIEIYSQAPSQMHDTYVDDSFCVTADDPSEVSVRVEEYSILERAERELEQRQRKRRFKESECINKRKRIKRRNILNHTSSSEDETETLRKQIQDESFYLKNSCQRS